MGVLSGEMQQGTPLPSSLCPGTEGCGRIAGSGVQRQVLAELRGAGPRLGLGTRAEGSALE